MGDERLIEIAARAIREAPMRATLRSGGVVDPIAPLTDAELNRGRAALAAIRNAGCAIVPLEGEEFEAAVERAIVAYIDTARRPWRNAVPAILRAALSPGDDT
jgi:hypothetical protein